MINWNEGDKRAQGHSQWKREHGGEAWGEGEENDEFCFAQVELRCL